MRHPLLQDFKEVLIGQVDVDSAQAMHHLDIDGIRTEIQRIGRLQ